MKKIGGGGGSADRLTPLTTIIDGVDLVRRLDTYVENDYLKATTQFCTTKLLLHFGYHKVKGIPIDAIRK